MADDEFVIGFSDSEWTGIAPILEEDVAMSSIAQDELGHARALYELLAGLRDDGRDADAIAYDREPDAYRHARLLDHPRGDWADTIARRFLYDTADAARLASIGDGWPPLAELIDKIRREERYHVMHMTLWAERLARAGGDARAALRRRARGARRRRGHGPRAARWRGRAPRRGRAHAIDGGRSGGVAAGRARESSVRSACPSRLGRAPDEAKTPGPAIPRRSRWLWGEFTSVRRSEPGATW